MNIIYIGKKPVNNYIVAIMTAFSDRQNDGSVIVKARGKAINQMVNVVEVLRNRFLKDIQIEDISIGTEELEDDEGRPRKVSTMQIILKR